jgi:hypothetical protein
LVENPTGVTDPSADRLRNGAGDMTLDLAQKQEWMKKFTSSAIFEKLNSLKNGAGDMTLDLA